MLPIHLSKSEQDLGVCLNATCPHCQQESEFRLRLQSAALLLFGYAVADFDRSYELMCNLCKFRKGLASDELSAAQTAQRLYGQLKAHELNPTQYQEALDALDFPSRRALREEASSWSCPVCKEKVPTTLNGCWKCSSPRSGLLASDSLQQDDSPRLPNAVTRPANPWEQ